LGRLRIGRVWKKLPPGSTMELQTERRDSVSIVAILIIIILVLLAIYLFQRVR
jgi:hypothetical protein